MPTLGPDNSTPTQSTNNPTDTASIASAGDAAAGTNNTQDATSTNNTGDAAAGNTAGTNNTGDAAAGNTAGTHKTGDIPTPGLDAAAQSTNSTDTENVAPSLNHNGKSFSVADPTNPESFKKAVNEFLGSLGTDKPMDMDTPVTITGDWTGKGKDALTDLISSGAKIELGDKNTANLDEENQQRMKIAEDLRKTLEENNQHLGVAYFRSMLELRLEKSLDSEDELSNTSSTSSTSSPYTIPSGKLSLSTSDDPSPSMNSSNSNSPTTPTPSPTAPALSLSSNTGLSSTASASASASASSSPTSPTTTQTQGNPAPAFQTQKFPVKNMDFNQTVDDSLAFLKKKGIDPTTATATIEGNWRGDGSKKALENGEKAVEKLIRSGIAVNFGSYAPNPDLVALNQAAQQVRAQMETMKANGQTCPPFDKMLTQQVATNKQAASTPTTPTSTTPTSTTPTSTTPTSTTPTTPTPGPTPTTNNGTTNSTAQPSASPSSPHAANSPKPNLISNKVSSDQATSPLKKLSGWIQSSRNTPSSDPPKLGS